MPVVALLRRETSVTGPINPIYITGFCIAGIIVLSLVFWAFIRLQRKWAASKREEQRGAAFLSVRGIVRDGDEKSSQNVQGSFARGLDDPTVIFPDKVISRPPRAREDILEYHRQSGTFPQPFAAKPFAFALSAGSGNPNSLGPESANRSSWRNSFMSGSTLQSRFSVMSTNSSIDSNPTTGTARKVRQVFEPVLPDELLVTKVGEQLTVVQSFDDGWCLVGREGGVFFATAKSLFKPNVMTESDVELGVVPAWCFVKPVLGLRAERPVRSSSLGITVQVSKPGFSSRDEIRSWSNF